MGRALLVEPNAAGRISGGYLYNARMAAHGAWDLADKDPKATDLDPTGHDIVLADSIWLTEEGIEPFLRLKARGQRVALLLHSFPSMIAAAESGLGVRSEPTQFELEAIEAIGSVIVPGPHYVERLRPHADVRVVEPGVDDGWRARPRARSGACAIVSVGAVTPRKGFLDVARVLEARARRDDHRWIVVGSLEVDREYARRVRKAAERLGTVTLIGQQSPDETRAVVQAADVLVMPSYDENHPLVLLEAIAASVPSVAYAAGAAASMLGGGAGLVAPIGDTSGLAAHLERLIGDEAERRRMAERCWELAASIPSWVTAAARARDVLSELARARRT